MTGITTATLQQRAIRGAAWMLSTSIGARAIGLVGTLLLARYLAPHEYGVVMAAAIVALTASSVTTCGVGIYLVSNPGISRADAFHASCWFLVTGAVALAATLMLGGPLGEWTGAPGLAAFLPVLIAATLLDRITYVPERFLIRQLRFRWLSVTRAMGELTFTAVAVALAASGEGAMAIAWGSLARSASRFVTVVPAVHIREWLEPHRLRLATFRRIVAYGTTVSMTTIAVFGLRRWDALLVSRYFGAGFMGAYNYAYSLADTPATALGDQMSDILGAAFPRVDGRRRAEALVRSCSMVAMIMFPLAFGLAAVAPTVVETFFDPRWSTVGTMLVCLSALSLARPLASMFAVYLYASGRPGTVLGLECATLAGIVAAVSTLGRAGIYWACLSVSLVFVLRALGGMWVVRRQDGVPISAFLTPMTKPLVACMVMTAGVSAVRLALADLTPAARLAVEIALGAALYVGGAMLLARSSCEEILRAVRCALGKGPTSVPAGSREKPAAPRVLSLSTEFPNPSEPVKGLFVRSRLAAIAARTCLSVIAPVAALDYANPQRNLFAAVRIPRQRQDNRMHVLHPRWVYPPRGGWLNAFLLFARLLPMVVRVRARRPFDVIDAHFAHPEGIAAVLLGRVLRCPVLVTVRGCEQRYRQQRSRRFWMSWALRRADRVIAVSDGLRQLAIDLGADPRRVKTVPNGINPHVFFRRNRVESRARYGIAAGERIILSAGDLAEAKGHHRIITAVKTLSERGVKARLLVAGGVGRSGRYAETLRQQVRFHGLGDQVTFLGEVTQDSLAQLMSASDVFCLASSSEGWPNVVNEALACGTPIVATDVGAVRQMVDSPRYGFVVPVRDGAALADALGGALTTQWEHDAISARGRARSWDQVAHEVLEQMDAVLAERSRIETRVGGTAARQDRRAPLSWKFFGLGRS